MYGHQPRIQQVCALLTFGADIYTQRPSLELWSGLRVQAPMSPARSNPPPQDKWGQPPRTQQVQPPPPSGCQTIHDLACSVPGTILSSEERLRSRDSRAGDSRAPHSSLSPSPQPYTFHSQPQTLTPLPTWLEQEKLCTPSPPPTTQRETVYQTYAPPSIPQMVG